VEHLTSVVSSRGILKSCSVHNRRPVSSSAEIDQDLLAGHKAGGSIYVCTDAIAEFARRFLPQVSAPFTLVTGDSDRAVSPDSLGAAVLRTVTEHELCLGWFAQNLATTHYKLQALPIGLDYHTMTANPGFWGVSQVFPVAQEHALLATWSRSPGPNER
jgi:hypothetical protein